MPNAALTGSRLILEPIIPDHAALLFDAMQDPDLYRFIPQDPPLSIDLLAERYRRLATRQSPDGREIWLNWAVRLTDTAQPQPFIGYLQAGVDQAGQGMLAYLIFTPYQQRGYAFEACTIVLNRLFEHFRCSHVDAFVDTRNIASWTLLNRLGFTRLRLIPDADRFKGGTSNEYHYRRTTDLILPVP